MGVSYGVLLPLEGGMQWAPKDWRQGDRVAFVRTAHKELSQISATSGPFPSTCAKMHGFGTHWGTERFATAVSRNESQFSEGT
jgi:hypothetical protein